MNSIVSAILGVVLVVGVGSFVLWRKNAQNAAFPTQTPQGMEVGSPAPIQGTGAGDDDVDDDNDDDAFEDVSTPSAVSGGGAQGSPASAGITASVVATHATRVSCWSIINGNVYDLTSWIPQHPGGEGAILQLCGTDGSTKFNGKHGGAQKQATILAGFKIGVLAQ